MAGIPHLNNTPGVPSIFQYATSLAYLSYNFFIAALRGALLVLYMCGDLVVILTPTLPLISIPILSPSLLQFGTRIVPLPTAYTHTHCACKLKQCHQRCQG